MTDGCSRAAYEFGFNTGILSQALRSEDKRFAMRSAQTVKEQFDDLEKACKVKFLKLRELVDDMNDRVGDEPWGDSRQRMLEIAIRSQDKVKELS